MSRKSTPLEKHGILTLKRKHKANIDWDKLFKSLYMKTQCEQTVKSAIYI